MGMKMKLWLHPASCPWRPKALTHLASSRTTPEARMEQAGPGAPQLKYRPLAPLWDPRAWGEARVPNGEVKGLQ